MWGPIEIRVLHLPKEIHAKSVNEKTHECDPRTQNRTLIDGNFATVSYKSGQTYYFILEKIYDEYNNNKNNTADMGEGLNPILTRVFWGQAEYIEISLDDGIFFRLSARTLL